MSRTQSVCRLTKLAIAVWGLVVTDMMTGMQPEHDGIFRHLREPVTPGPVGRPGRRTAGETYTVSAGDAEKLVCRRCCRVITGNSERIAVRGSHEHTFANPAGILYQIGCFCAAAGCAQVGLPTQEWSWFAGYSWRVAVCGTCRAHMGWQFLAPGGGFFYGLILDRLVSAGRPSG